MCCLRLQAFQQNQGLADTNNIPVADHKLRNDPTLKVLHRSPIAIGAYDARCYCAAGERHNGSPADKRKHKETHDNKAQAERPA